MAQVIIDDTNLNNIGNAIRNQNKTTATYFPSEMADAINALPVLDTSDATATASDIVDGKTAYVNGEKITGNIYHSSASMTVTKNFGQNGNYFYYTYPTTNAKKVIGDGASLTINIAMSNFGDATAADVVSGKTFTSSAGLKITGTASSSSSGASGGSTVKSGTTTSATISTGLSSIDYMVIYKTSFGETGLIQAVYNAETDTLNYTYCSSYSSYTKTCAVSSSTASSVSGGTFTLGLSGTSGLSSRITYNWVAFGQA